MKVVLAAIATLIGLICAIPFVGADIKIEAIVWLAIPFVALGGAAGFITRKIEGVVAGIVMAALFPVLLQMVGDAMTSAQP